MKIYSHESGSASDNVVMAINKVIGHHQGKTGRGSILNYSLGPQLSGNNRDWYDDNTGVDVVTFDALKLATAYGISVTTAAGNGFSVSSTGSSIYGPLESTFTNGQMNLSPEESGNTDTGQGVPVVVGAVNTRTNRSSLSQKKMAYFSDYGRGNTVNAPGAVCVVPHWSEDGYYVWKSGTSFSSPMVAGLISLRLELNRMSLQKK